MEPDPLPSAPVPAPEPAPEPPATAAGFRLSFQASSIPERIGDTFLARGGQLSSAQCAGATDFAVTGAERSTTTRLPRNGAWHSMEIALPPSMVLLTDTASNTIHVDHRAQVLMASTRGAIGLKGHPVETHAGEGSTHLHDLLEQTTATILAQYGAWGGHAAVVTLKNAEVLDANGVPQSVHFTRNDETESLLQRAQAVQESFAQSAWDARQSSLVFHEAPTLVPDLQVAAIGGVNDSGATLAHNVITQPTPLTLATVESMLRNMVQTQLSMDDTAITEFERLTARPTLAASARYAPIVATALSMNEATLKPYHYDGISQLGSPTGNDPIVGLNVEKWSTANRGEADDCEGSARSVSEVYHRVQGATAAERAAFPYVNAVGNVLLFHAPFLGIVGAASPEAGSAPAPESGQTEALAGHAVFALHPRDEIHRALVAGSKRLGKASQEAGESEPPPKLFAPTDAHAALAAAWHEALYPDAILDRLSADDRQVVTALASVDAHAAPRAAALAGLTTLFVEGTTPADARIYIPEKDRAAVRSAIEATERAVEALGSHIGRPFRQMHTTATGEHAFYRKAVQLYTRRDDPIYTSPKLRSMGHASTQFALLPEEPGSAGTVVDGIGVTPHQLAHGMWSAVPVLTLGTEAADALDFGSQKAAQNMMPPRHSAAVMTAAETAQYSLALDALTELHQHLKAKPASTGGTPVTLFLTTRMDRFPDAVRHFTEHVGKHAKSGVVDCLFVPEILMADTGEDVGRQVVVHLDM